MKVKTRKPENFSSVSVTYQRRVELEVCTFCGINPPLSGRRKCLKCSVYLSTYKKQWRSNGPR